MLPSTTEPLINSAPEYTLSKRRWVLTAVFSLLNMSNACIWLTYSPVSEDAANYFNVDMVSVNYFSMVFMAITVVLMLPSAWVIQEIGLLPVLLITAVLNCGSAWIRFASHGNYAITMVGQSIGAIACAGVVVSPVHFSAVWMGDHERTTSTGIASFANIFGIGVIYLIAPQFGDNIPLLELVVAIITTSTLVLMILFKKAPDSPPSAASTVEKLRFGASLKALVTTKSWLALLLVPWGIGSGIINTLVTICDDLGKLAQFTEMQSGYLIVGLIGGGVIGAVTSGVYIDKTRKYKEALITCFMGATLLMIVMIFVMKPGNYTPTLILFIFYGAICMAVVPTCLELSVELSFPTPEAFLGALMFTVNQLAGAVGVALASVIPTGLILIVFTCTLPIALGLGLWLKKDYRRLNYELGK